MAGQNRFGIVLRRGARYRHADTVYLRGVPAVVTQDVRDYLVEETGFFRDVELDAKGRPVPPKTVMKRGRRGRARFVRNDRAPALVDTGAGEAHDV